MLIGYYQKTRKGFQKKLLKSTKISLKRCQYAYEQYRNLSEEEKEKKH